MAEFASENELEFHKDDQKDSGVDRIIVSTLKLSADQTCLRLVHISDTHNKSSKYLAAIPEGDVFIHSGDFTNTGNAKEMENFRNFLSKLPHEHKVVVFGNHEVGMDKRTSGDLLQIFHGVPGLIILQDSGVTIKGVNFWGSSWNNVEHGHAAAWGTNERERSSKWELIPEDTNVLITHIPPYGILDLAWLNYKHNTSACQYCGNFDQIHGSYGHWGCASLRRKIKSLRTVSLHCFGHVHDTPGIEKLKCMPNTIFSNAAQDLRITVGNVFDLVPATRKDQESEKSGGGSSHNQPMSEPTTLAAVTSAAGTDLAHVTSTMFYKLAGAAESPIHSPVSNPNPNAVPDNKSDPNKLKNAISTPAKAPQTQLHTTSPKVKFILLNQNVRLCTTDPNKPKDVNFVLDVDATLKDQSRRSLISWRALSHQPRNQTWKIELRDPWVADSVKSVLQGGNSVPWLQDPSPSLASSSGLAPNACECFIMSGLGPTAGLAVEVTTGVTRLHVSDQAKASDECWVFTLQPSASFGSACCYTIYHKKTGLYLEHSTEKTIPSRVVALIGEGSNEGGGSNVNRLWYLQKLIG